MTQKEQCKMCKEFPPCEKGVCCKRCVVRSCNSRQCENKVASRRVRDLELPWYLRNEKGR